jgi:hypothetical protein
VPTRPIHRWPSLWLGLFVTAFLGWAWWDSHRYYSALTWIGKGIAWNAGGKLGCSLVVQSLSGPGGFATTRMSIGSVWLGGIFAKFETYALPHWVLFVSFLVLWATFLLWRWRRLRRSTKNEITFPSATS